MSVLGSVILIKQICVSSQAGRGHSCSADRSTHVDCQLGKLHLGITRIWWHRDRQGHDHVKMLSVGKMKQVNTKFWLRTQIASKWTSGEGSVLPH